MQLKKMSLRSVVSERLENLKKARKFLESTLSKYPEGKIRVSRRGDRIQFYLRNNSSEISGSYISKSKKKTIRTFLRKSYEEKALKLINKEILALENFEKQYGMIDEEIQKLYGRFPEEAREYLDPIDVSDEEFASMWQNQPFESKGIQETSTQYITDRGERVRSKSELNIANTLNKLGIPYKYECPVEIRKGVYFYPDFTVLNIRRRKILYWEHRGMMDDREYAKHSVSRVKEYERNGIILGRDLIISEETLSDPLGSNDILRIIKAYLL